MRHGYTNATATDGRTVVKRYRGPDAEQRQHTEVAALTAMTGRVPVPPVITTSPGQITLGFVDGRPGQELLEERPEDVLEAVGRLARALVAAPDGRFLVHGDFGPQNLLLDEETLEPTALLDWEFAHAGDPDEHEDVAWAEWIVRTHHPHLVPALPALFAGYGTEPAWRVRQEAMMAKCGWALGFARRWTGAEGAVDLWRQRLTATAAFTPSSLGR